MLVKNSEQSGQKAELQFNRWVPTASAAHFWSLKLKLLPENMFWEEGTVWFSVSDDALMCDTDTVSWGHRIGINGRDAREWAELVVCENGCLCSSPTDWLGSGRAHSLHVQQCSPRDAGHPLHLHSALWTHVVFSQLRRIARGPIGKALWKATLDLIFTKRKAGGNSEGRWNWVIRTIKKW